MADLSEQILAVTPPRPETKQDVIDYYRESYGANWASRAAFDLSGETSGKAYHNARRNFEGDRLHSPGKTAKWREFGKTLPLKPPPGGYHIYGTVWMKFSDGECEEREVDEYITGDDARSLLSSAVASASRDAAQAVINHYMEDAIWSEPSASIGDCNPPELFVDAIEE